MNNELLVSFFDNCNNFNNIDNNRYYVIYTNLILLGGQKFEDNMFKVFQINYVT